MRLLFVKPKHIGDSLLLTPTLAGVHQMYPEAEIWVILRSGCEGIMAGCPFIHRVLTIAEVQKHERGRGIWKRELRVWLELWRVRFDYLFELGDGHRGRWLSLFARADRKYSVKPSTPLSAFWEKRFTAISKFDWQTCHRVEKDYHAVGEFLELPKETPGLTFDRACAIEWEPARHLRKFAVIQIGSRQRHKRWPADFWRSLATHLLLRFENVVVSTGPNEDEVADARELVAMLGPRAVPTLGKAAWPQMADLLFRAELLVTVDTAAMHLAAACQCPTVALFAKTVEDHWHPWKAPHRIVTVPGFIHRRGDPNQYEEIKAREITNIRPEDVIAACEAFASIEK